MKQLQTVYTTQQEFLSTLSDWADSLSHSSHKAIAHIFQRYDSSPKTDSVLQEILRLFESLLPNVPYVACTSAGEIANQHFTDEDFTVTLTVFEQPSTAVNIQCFSANDLDLVEEQLRTQVFSLTDLRGIEILSSLSPDHLFRVLSIFDSLPEEIAVFGGVSIFDDLHPAFVRCKESLCPKNSFVLISYCGPDLYLMADRINGWKPIGFPIQVTHSERDIVYSLNDAPAYNIYNHYLKIPNDRNFFYNTLEFPFVVTEPDGNTYIRHAKSCTESGAIIMSSYVPEGSTVRLSYGDSDSIIQTIKEQIPSIKAFHPETISIFTCLGRKLFWGNETNPDITPLRKIAPLFGGCFLGEILRYQGTTYLNNLSLVFVAMREGKSGKDFEIPADTTDTSILSLASRLANFINTMTGELQDANEQLTVLLKQATTDALTTLWNRGEIERRIYQYGSKKPDHPWSLIMTDIDDFKEINDTYSHSEGDFVLKKVSDTMKGIVEKYYPKASTGRWGGEEFMILLPDVSTDDAAKLAEILRCAITWIPFSSSRPISMSFGVTSHRKNESIKSTLLRVDQALYAAKAGGKNTVYKT